MTQVEDIALGTLYRAGHRAPPRAVTIVLLGHHGVGKTTTGLRLASMLAVPFDEEIGRVLASDPTWRALDSSAENAQPDFDAEVFRRELTRDALAPRLRIVETWHPGNLAYADARSPRVAERNVAAVRAAAARGRTLVVPLTASPTVLAARQSEPGSLSFFQAIADRSIEWARRLGLEILPPHSTDDQTPDAVARAILTNLGSLAWTAST